MSDAHLVGRFVADRARAMAAAVAVDDRGVSLTYGELDARSTALAVRLSAAGYGVGARVATLTGNSADHVVLFFACAKAGLVLVPLSWRLSTRELSPPSWSRPTLRCCSPRTSSTGMPAMPPHGCPGHRR